MMKTKLISTVALALAALVVALPAQADFDKGMAAYERKDYATALVEFQASAEQGDAKAQKWLRKAAEQGYSRAQFFLGGMYLGSEGVQKNYREAANWYRKAAEQGHSYSQSLLCMLYISGQGVPQSYTEAVNWCKKAAEQGNNGAQSNLGILYNAGKGVSRNPVIAYILLNLAAAGGNEEARENRTNVANKLSPKQLTEAQALSSAWKIGKPLPTKTATWPAR